jgi:hypothetical protein
MDFQIIKKIKYRPDNNLHWIFWIPLLVVLIPLIVLFLIVMIIWYGIHSIFSKNKKKIATEELPYLILDNERIKMELKTLDDTFSEIDDYWCDKVYDEDQYLYVAQTTPTIESIDGKLFGDFKLEKGNGVFLHNIQFEKTSSNLNVSSKLLYLDYRTLETKIIDEFGSYFLYNKKDSDNIICGFNKDSDIELEIKNVC